MNGLLAEQHNPQATETSSGSRDIVNYSAPTSAVAIRAHVNLIQEVMKDVMKENTHYGVIPGTKQKTLFKAGAETLCVTFHLGPDYEIIDKERIEEHLHITARCTLYHIETGRKVGSALGSCTTAESRYAYRTGKRVCPECGHREAIIKGKQEYGGGWLCYTSKGGCGTKFPDGDNRIESQTVGRVANDDLADQYNTVLKMACKRALLAATLNATGASDIFVQDFGVTDPHDEVLGFRQAPEESAGSGFRGAQPDEPLPLYPEAQFTKFLPKWKTAIANGTYKPDDLIQMISTRYRLTDDQTKRIKTLKMKGGAE